MASEQERELHSVVIDAQLRRNDYLYFEVLMVILAAGWGLMAALMSSEMLDMRRTAVWGAGAALVAAAYFHAYAKVILQPALNVARENLNEYIGGHEAR